MKPDLLNDPVPRLVRQIAMPASVGFFFNTMYNFVDTWCAGLLSTDALAALSLSFPVFFMLVVAGNGLGQGGTALIANALGKGDKEEARRIFTHAVMLAAAGGVVLTIIGMFSVEWLFGMLGAQGQYLKTALSYMNVILVGVTFFILQMTLNSVLSAQGETKTYRNVLIGGFFANCLLNPWFMFGWLGFPEMGIAGLALSTVLIQVVGSWVLWRHIKLSDFGKNLTRSHWKPSRAEFWKIAAQAVPASLNMLTVAVGIFVITWFVSQFSKEAVAAYGIATRIEQVILLPTIGLNFATLSLVGQNFGAGQMNRVRQTWQTALGYGAGMMLLGGVLLWLVRGAGMAWFTNDAEVIRHGTAYLGVAALTLCAYPILFVTVFMLQGLKKPAFGLWMGLYRQIAAPMLVFQGLAFLLGWGIWGVWWGICIVTWSGALFALWWGHRLLISGQASHLQVPISAQDSQ